MNLLFILPRLGKNKEGIMFFPNYDSNSLVNLISSLFAASGNQTKYSHLKLLPPQKLNSKNIVLIILDGLGWEFLKKHKKTSFLGNNILGKITSVFPPTTAAAITSILTGKAPGEHGVTGWFVYLKEIDLISTILPFSKRGTDDSLLEKGVKADEIFDQKNIFQKIKRNSFLITNDNIVNSTYSQYFSRGAATVSYEKNNIFDFVKKTSDIIKMDKGKKFIYTYWSLFDSLAHIYGINGKETIDHFWKIDKQLENLINISKDTETTFIITADHGLIDTTPENTIYLEQHPKLKELLSMPFSGEPRTVFCFVKENKEQEFINYYSKYLKKFCHIFKTEDLIKKNVFGLYNSHKNLKSRLGDYILIMKKNYIFKDFIPGENKYFHVGNHGGVSKNELYIPLIYKQTNIKK